VNTTKLLLILVASAGLAALLWKEYPAMARYIKIERM
jgi:hypothetical protein